jgi:hypothetical protein
MSRIARRIFISSTVLIFAAAPLAAQPASGGQWRCSSWRVNKASPQGRECSQWSSDASLPSGTVVPPPPFLNQAAAMAQPRPVEPKPGGVPAKREKHRQRRD